MGSGGKVEGRFMEWNAQLAILSIAHGYGQPYENVRPVPNDANQSTTSACAC